MNEKEILIKEITASEGKWLTPVVVNEFEPVFSKVIYLGVGDVVANWREVSEEEKRLIELNAIECRRQKVEEVRGR